MQRITPEHTVAIRRRVGTLNRKRIFLAGSIEMGSASKWQEVAEKLIFAMEGGSDTLVYNPRRDDWDISWDENSTELHGQIMWELRNLERCDHILMYLDPKTKSPISLLELGLHAKSGKLIVVCPKGFYRRRNVLTTCEFYKVPVAEDLQKAVGMIFGLT